MKSLIRVGVGLAIGLLLLVVIAWWAGENPWYVIEILYGSCFGSTYDLGTMLFHLTPMVFTGLAVAIPYRAGLFNVGAQGQMMVGALGCYGALSHLPPDLPRWFGFLLSAISAAVCGALYAGIAGVLKAWRSTHEVITTIMLNFVAAAAFGWAIGGPWRDFENSSPQTQPLDSIWVMNSWEFFDGALVGAELIIALLLVLGMAFLFGWSVWGFEVKILGEKPTVAESSGVRVSSKVIQSLCLGGASAGLALWGPIVLSGVLTLGLPSEYGYLGIAVALVAGGHPLAVVPAAFLFALLHKGGSDFDLETEHLTRDLVTVIQGILVLAVASQFRQFSVHLQRLIPSRQSDTRSSL